MSDKKSKKELCDLNIYQRLHRVMENCPKIPKEGYNSYSKYNYVRAVDVFNHIQKMFIEFGIVLSIEEISHEREKHGSNFQSRLKARATYVNIDNPEDKHSTEFYTVAADTLDKDIFKAKTGGLKFLFAQQFLLVTADIKDPEEDAPPTPLPKSSKVKPPAPKAKSKTLTAVDKEIKELGAKMKSKGWTKAQVAEFSKEKYGNENPRLLTSEQRNLLILDIIKFSYNEALQSVRQ